MASLKARECVTGWFLVRLSPPISHLICQRANVAAGIIYKECAAADHRSLRSAAFARATVEEEATRERRLRLPLVRRPSVRRAICRTHGWASHRNAPVVHLPSSVFFFLGDLLPSSPLWLLRLWRHFHTTYFKLFPLRFLPSLPSVLF